MKGGGWSWSAAGSPSWSRPGCGSRAGGDQGRYPSDHRNNRDKGDRDPDQKCRSNLGSRIKDLEREVKELKRANVGRGQINCAVVGLTRMHRQSLPHHTGR